jgi:hypothetical protein
VLQRIDPVFGLTAAENAISGNPGQFNGSVKAALDNDWVARDSLNLAMYQIHSGLLQYQHLWGTNVGIPDIPKWHLAPCQLPS